MKKTNNPQTGFLSVAVIISLCVIGIGTAAWHDTLKGTGTVETGEIDMIFTNASISSDQPADADVSISGDGKKISVFIDGAYQEDVMVLDYTVKNAGGIPARFRIEAVSGDPGLIIHNSFPGGMLEKNQSDDGAITFKIVEVEEPGECNFDIELHFQQWNIPG